MRPVHLLAVALCALLALASLWFGTGRGRSAVHAADALADEDGGAGGAASLQAAAAEAATAASGRVAIFTGPSPEERAKAEAERKKKAARKVEGRVVDAAGIPVPGASVWATTEGNWIEFPLDVEEEAVPNAWLERKRAEADTEGRFAFEGLEPGRLRIAVRAAGFAPTYLDHLELPPYEQHSVGDVKLAPGVRVTGRVLGPDGEPYPGARILIALDCVNRASLVRVPGRGVEAGTSGPDGGFVVDQLAPGPWHLLFVAPECLVEGREGRIEHAGGTQAGVVVRLTRGATIQGRIVCKDAPIPPGLRVAARRQVEERNEEETREHVTFDPTREEEPADSVDALRTRTAQVDPEGGFTLHGLEGGATYRLTVAKALQGGGFKGFTAVEAQNVRAPRAGVELVLKPESAILFRAVDDVTGEPITELVVYSGIGRERVLRDEKGEVQHCFADGRVRYGELRIPPTNTKPIPLRVSANGYKDHENKNTGLRTGVELDLGDIRLVRDRVVVVTVRDAVTSEPVEDARVVLSATRDEEDLVNTQNEPLEQTLLGDQSLRVARTGADGKARLSCVGKGGVLVVAVARDYRPSRATRVPYVPDSDHEITIGLERGGSVVVRVTDGTGRPVEGVGVQHRLPKANLDDENVAGTRKSDAQGLVRFASLVNGVHGFRVHEDDGDVWMWSEDGSESPPEPWHEVAIIDGRTAEIEFVAAPRGSVFGTVREGGRLVEGAHVKFVPRASDDKRQGQAYWGGGNDPFATVSRHDGSYEITHLRTGEYTAVVVLRHRTMPAEFKVRVGVERTRHDFDVDVSGVEGRVVDEDGRPLAGLQVRAWRTQGGLEVDAPYQMVVKEDDRGNPDVEWKQVAGRSIRTDAQGLYRIPGLATGEPIAVGVSGDWVEEKHSPEFQLAPGEVRVGIDFKLRRAGQVRVQMTHDVRGREEWYECRLVPIGEPEGRSEGMTWVGAWSRSGEIRSMLPGRYKLTVKRNQDGSPPPLLEVEVDVAIGQMTEVPFDPRR